MKLPKGVKKLKVAGSKTALEDSIAQLCSGEFNGHIRVTAPQGVKEAGILVFLQSLPQLAVYQSPDRSVYGSEAVAEILRISTFAGSLVRAEAYFTHDLIEVDTIVTKMRKAAVTQKDLADAGMRLSNGMVQAKTPPAPPAAQQAPRGTPTPRAAKAQGAAARPGSTERIPPTPSTEKHGAPPVKVVPKPARLRAPPEVPLAAPRASEPAPPKAPKAPRPPASRSPAEARSGPPGKEGDEEFLKVLKDVGLSPPSSGSQSEGTISGDEIDQYIAAFETYIDKAKHEPPRVPSQQAMQRVVDEIMDEMIAAAGDDEWTKGFIESQRDLVLEKVKATSQQVEGIARQRDVVEEERATLADISKTFQDVLRATEQESRKHKEELDRVADEEGDDADWLKRESSKLQQQADRLQEMEKVLAGVLGTHQMRYERVESELEEAEAETQTEVKQELVHLETLKTDVLEEMRDRIRGMSTTPEGAPSEEGAEKAAKSISEGIHEQVEALEQERNALAEEERRLEGEARTAAEREQTLEVDQQVEVRARLEELESREGELKRKEEALLEMERKLSADRAQVEDELTKSRSQQMRLRALEAEVARREEGVKAKESELEGALRSSEEVDAKLRDIRASEARLKAREMQLVARESELDAASEKAKRDREEGVEADLKRVGSMEAELKRRQAEYARVEKEAQGRIEALQDELELNRERVKELEERLALLQGAEDRARTLEASIAKQRGVAASGGIDEKELKKILAYLDDLLSHLPDSKVEEFSQSEYFELYDRILRRLGI